jgi:hypothetical protein
MQRAMTDSLLTKCVLAAIVAAPAGVATARRLPIVVSSLPRRDSFSARRIKPDHTVQTPRLVITRSGFAANQPQWHIDQRQFFVLGPVPAAFVHDNIGRARQRVALFSLILFGQFQPVVSLG